MRTKQQLEHDYKCHLEQLRECFENDDRFGVSYNSAMLGGIGKLLGIERTKTEQLIESVRGENKRYWR